ncbi:MAG: hypothetical protein CMK53_09530 [Proteobacteria bacterium]|nr:hypothetical protein [Pseudomonadota bacterium]
MDSQKYTFQEKFKYTLDNLMSKGGLYVFLALLLMFMVAFIVMGAVRVIIFFFFHDPNIEDPLQLIWHAFSQITDSGALAELDTDSNLAGKLVGIATISLGIVLFSSMVAFITQEFDKRLAMLRKGKSKVIEEDHILIVGFSERVIDIIREIVLANESDEGVIAILADMDKEELDDYLRDRIVDLQSTRVITRSGSTTSLINLQNAGIDVAHSVVVLNTAKASDNNDVKEAADAKVLKTIMAVVAAKGEDSVPPVVAEVHIDRYRNLAETIVEGKITTLNEADLLARMLVQTSRCEGLSMVYMDLVGFEGNEFYFFRPDQGWGTQNFGELQYRFMETVPLGVRNSEGTITMNPPLDYVLNDDDDIIVLAEDDSTINYSDNQVIEPKTHTYSTDRAEIPVEKHMIVGWNNKAPIVLKEYASYMIKGSAVNLVVENLNPKIKKEFEDIRKQFSDIEMKCKQIDYHSKEQLKRLKLQEYTTVSILAGSGEEAEEIDSKTIMRLLQIRNIFQEHTRATGNEIQTKLITEIVESENTELVLKAGVKDFLISNQFVSKIFAQVAEDPDVMRVYDDLFSEEGSEVYVKPISLYFEEFEKEDISFADCVLAAQKRSEICFGIKIRAEEFDSSKSFGINLIPNKKTSYKFQPGDALITLAEDES